MVQQAESHAEEDKKKKEFIEQKNTADSLIYNTGKSLGEHKEKMDSETVTLVENAIKECEEALAAGEDVDNLKSKVDALQQASMKIGEAVYKGNDQGASGDNSSESGDTKEGNKDDNTADAEFEEKKEKETKN